MNKRLVAKNINERLEKNGMTGKALADAIGASTSAVSSWRTGDSEPSLSYVLRMADVFGCKITDITGLLGGKNFSTKNVTPWLVRRKPGTKKVFEVVSFNEHNNGVIIAKEFKDLEEAQDFAAEANLMIGRAERLIGNA